MAPKSLEELTLHLASGGSLEREDRQRLIYWLKELKARRCNHSEPPYNQRHLPDHDALVDHITKQGVT